MAVWTRAGLRAAAVDDRAIRRALQRGELLRVGWDRYTDLSTVALERVVAVPGTQTALWSVTAARAWGLPVPGGAPVTVAVPHGTRRRALPEGVVVRRVRVWSAIERDGVLVTDLPTTLAAVARDLAPAESVPVLDAGLGAGCSLGELRRALTGRHPGNARARAAIDLADGRAESPLESLLRLTLVLAGLLPLDVQHQVWERGRRVGRVDLWYPGVVVEADGFEFHSGRAEYVSDRRKGQAYARLGLLVLRFSWEDVVHRPDHVVASVRAAIKQAARLAA